MPIGSSRACARARARGSDYVSDMQLALRSSIFAFVIASAACGSSAPRAEEPADHSAVATSDDRPYMHECAPDGSGSACAVDECVAWKTEHGATEEDALAECMQDCNCGE
jgi:hypothetical protein